ncbi:MULTISPECIES: lactonase family protein [unclassified Lacticaseibacillus]|uniref:lactonase family protein n=1 Tax=unclassified Lacticaseibacillus TaxID=2759744 RepID=UPI001940D7A7|nr:MULTISPECIES: lactonase family protein [unclassified Lacticaseibacillus]
MKETVLLGGYTKHEGQGVYRATFDSETGRLSEAEPYITGIGSPTYLAVSKANAAYLVDAADGKGGLAAFDLNQTPPQLLNTVLEPGTSPAHVSIDEKRQLVFAANYHEGRVNVYKINADRTLTPTDVARHHGHGPLPEQDASHVHFAALTPDGRLAVIDLGTDEVYTYPVDDAGKLGTPAILKLAPGFGPRHLVFHHDKPIAYLLGELSSQISVLQYDPATGGFTQGQTQKTIPADWTKHNGAAAIRISSDSRFIYATNRGYNSVVVYSVSEDGLELTEVQQISTEGDFPRDANLDLTENYLLAVNQNTSNATLYSRDSGSGKLTAVQKDIVAPESVNVVFLKA